MFLTYIGSGKAIPGIPAHDIDAEEPEASALLESGLFEPAGGEPLVWFARGTDDRWHAHRTAEEAAPNGDGGDEAPQELGSPTSEYDSGGAAAPGEE